MLVSVTILVDVVNHGRSQQRSLTHVLLEFHSPYLTTSLAPWIGILPLPGFLPVNGRPGRGQPP